MMLSGLGNFLKIMAVKKIIKDAAGKNGEDYVLTVLYALLIK